MARRQTEALPKSLKAYVKAAWNILVPGRPLVWHFGLDAICDHLEAVSHGQIEKLIMNVPPGMLKSTMVSVFWPTWEWTWRPPLKWMFSSYAQNLSYRDAGYRRQLIQSRWYQQRWRYKFGLTKAGDEVVQNTYMGHFFATSTGASTTGFRGDRLVLDDPQDPSGAESEVKRGSTIEWLNRTWPTRRDAGPWSAEVLIQQRLHEMDATGLYLSQGGWVHLKIPLEYKGKAWSTPIGYKEPRTKLGEVITDTIYPPAKVVDLKKRLGPYGAAGQLDQEPAPSEGGIIKRAWLREYPGTTPKMDDEIPFEMPGGLVYRIRPRNCIRFCIVDPATTEQQTIARGKQNDPDWFVLGAFLAFATNADPKDPRPIVALLDIDMGKWSGEDHEPKIKAFHEKWEFQIIAVESFGFQLSLFQKLKNGSPPLPVKKLSNADPENDDDAICMIDADKAARAYNAAPLMADARFFIPTYHLYLGEYINQNTLFPNASHDDCMDVTSGAVAVAQSIKYDQRGVQVAEQEKEHPVDTGAGYTGDRLPKDQDEESHPMEGIRTVSPYGKRDARGLRNPYQR